MGEGESSLTRSLSISHLKRGGKGGQREGGHLLYLLNSGSVYMQLAVAREV